MDEAERKRKLVAEVNALHGGRARRIEHRYAVGVLDLIIKLPRLPQFWAEAKIIKGNLFGPTGRQFEEGKQWLAADVPVLLLGWRDSILYVSPWVEEADRRQCAAGVDWIRTITEYLSESRR